MNNRYFILLVVMLIATPTLYGSEKITPLKQYSLQTVSNPTTNKMTRKQDNFLIDYQKKRRNALVVGFVGVACIALGVLTLGIMPTMFFKDMLAAWILMGISNTLIHSGFPMMIAGFAVARSCKKKMYIFGFNDPNTVIEIGVRFYL